MVWGFDDRDTLWKERQALLDAEFYDSSEDEEEIPVELLIKEDIEKIEDATIKNKHKRKNTEQEEL